MEDPSAFDEAGPPGQEPLSPEPLGPEPPGPEPPSRARRSLTIAILITLTVSIVFLAFVSGRGLVEVAPDVSPGLTVAPSTANDSRLAVVDAGGRLETTDAAGGSVVPYGQPGVSFSFPAWSPDGSRIAVLGQRGSESAVYLFTTHAEGAAATDPTIIYSSADRPPFYLYWAPDGHTLTFLTTEPDGIALRMAPADASAPASIVRHGSPMYWVWADPGRLLVHSGGADGFFGEVGADGTSVEPEAIEPGGFRAPAVTSDGRFRAYVAPGNGTTQQVVVESRDRSNPHRLIVFGAAAIEFGPATSELAFIAPATTGREVAFPVGPLRLIDAASGDVRTLLAGSVVAFFWSPDGRTIAALEVTAPGDDKVATSGETTLASVRMPRDTRVTDIPAVAPGTSSLRTAAASGLALGLAFVDVDSGTIRSQRPVLVSDTFTAQLLPFFDQYALSHRLWSADGASIVIPVVADDGTDRLLVVQANGSGARPVADGVAGFWSP